jgi:hypothetical protein
MMLKHLQYVYCTAGMESASQYVFIYQLILLACEYIFISLYSTFLFFLTPNLVALRFNCSTCSMYTYWGLCSEAITQMYVYNRI